MIIDAHMHTFPNLMKQFGERSLEAHNMYLQRFVAASPAAAVRRVKDNQIVEEKELYLLWDDQDKTPAGAYAVDFHASRFGRLAWTKNGVEYYIPLYAPNMQEMESSPEFLIAEMDYAKVSVGILQNAFLYGDLNGYIAEAVKKYPTRFIGTIQINEARAYEPAEIKKLENGAINQGLKALYFANERFFENGFTLAFDDEVFTPFWDVVRELELPVFWDISAVQEPGEVVALSPLDRFMKQMYRFEAWHKRYPEIPSILVHGIPLRSIRDKDSFLPISDDLWRIWKRKNMFLELLFPMQVSHPVKGGTAWEFPYTEVHPLIKDLLSQLGAEKMVWGTDLPNTERNCTYVQARSYIDKHCPLLGEADKKLVFGDNIQRIFKLLC